MRITLKSVEIIPVGLTLTVDITFIKIPNLAKYAEVLKEYQGRPFGLLRAILIILKARAGMRRGWNEWRYCEVWLGQPLHGPLQPFSGMAS